MNTPEHGHSTCSFKDYEAGKQFIVSPGRLCIDGIYMFAVKPPRGWKYEQEAYLFMSKVMAINPQEDNAQPYSISISIEDMYRPNIFENPTPPLPASAEGLIMPHSTRPNVFDEAYLRHKFDSLEMEAARIGGIETVPFRVMTVPHALSSSD